MYRIILSILFLMIIFSGCGEEVSKKSVEDIVTKATVVTLQSITLTPVDSNISLGFTQQLTATGTYSDGTTVDITSAITTWDSVFPTIATTNSTGLVSSLALGSTIITASLDGVSSSTLVTITAASLQSIALTPVDLNISLGSTQQLTATGTYSDGTTVDITSAITTWSSMSPAVATINSTGLTTSLAVGSTIITASLDGVSSNTNIVSFIMGSLDTSFNSIGYVTNYPLSISYGMAIDATGKVVTAGQMFNGSNNDMVVWRYNNDGTLDTSFNSPNGYLTYDAGGQDYANAMAIDDNGKIVLVGSSATSNLDMAIWRYNSDGTLDTSFNSPNGYVTLNFSTGINFIDRANAITIDADGKILVAGTSENTNEDMLIWRFNSDGTLDTSFNGQGYTLFDSNKTDIGNSITIDSSGKIIVSGYLDNGANVDMAIWRYESNGSLDISFNGQGYTVFDSGNEDYGFAITVDSSDKIIVTGTIGVFDNTEMAIWRYNSNGTLDTNFNTVGYTTHNSAAGGVDRVDIGLDIIIDANEKIIASGYSYNNSNNADMTLWRYNNDGTLDISFNSMGYLIHDMGNQGHDMGYSVLFDIQGKIVVSGRSDIDTTSTSIGIWRYE